MSLLLFCCNLVHNVVKYYVRRRYAMDLNFDYRFPAIRGIQAGKEYYITMIPLNIIDKLIHNDEDVLPPEYRAQRIINRSRIPEIKNYILDNRSSYVFSSLTASVDGEIKFESSKLPGNNDLGMLIVSMGARFLINDGQHRRAAIEEALFEDEGLKNETISIVIFKDEGLQRSQQMFSDLNKHAVNTTKSIGILYDSREPMAILSRKIVNEVELFRKFTDKEKSTLAKFSPKVFTLSNIYSATSKFIEKYSGDIIPDNIQNFAIHFWNEICESTQEYKALNAKKVVASELRSMYVITHGTVIEAFGIIGKFIFENKVNDWEKVIKKLDNIDWSRENKEWLNRTIDKKGKIIKNSQSIKLTANLIKMKLGFDLTEEEKKLEEKIK